MPRANNLEIIRRELDRISKSTQRVSRSFGELNDKMELRISDTLPNLVRDLEHLYGVMQRMRTVDLSVNFERLALTAKANIDRVKRELANLFAANVRGGVPTPMGIRGAVEQQVAGDIKPGGRIRLGGKAYVSQAKGVQQEVARLTAEIRAMEAVLANLKNAWGATSQQMVQDFRKVGVTIDWVGQELDRELNRPAREKGWAAQYAQETEARLQQVSGSTEKHVKHLESLRAQLERPIPSGRTGPAGTQDELTKQQLAAKKAAEEFAKLKQVVADYYRTTPKGMQSINKALSKNGMTMNNLKNVYVEASTGVARFSFQTKEATGFVRQLNISIDRSGNLLADRQRRFAGFFAGIQRNFIEAFKWTAAIALIYGPVRKLQEIIEEAIKNEAELAKIATILGKAHDDMGRIFEAAADAAYATGESIGGVLESYTLAYRATGRYTNEVQRNQVAQQLLVDSLLLSKLSTLDQAVALDTLAGALNQTGLNLDQGRKLLDIWVATTKTANVDLNTLAETFAITATSAQNAGVGFEELNAVVAVVAENTTLSATEAGNAVRAFISGFQTQKAQSELSKFGVAVQTLDGDTKDFLEVMRSIKSLFDAGLIDESQLNRISEAIGGGARRGAQVATFIKNLDRMDEILKEISDESNTAGAAQDALARQTETVQTAVTRLNNAFVELGQTLGTEGGILDYTKQALEVFTNIVDTINDLVDATDKAIPILATFAGIYLGMSRTQFGMGMGFSGLSMRGPFSAMQQPRGLAALPPGADQLYSGWSGLSQTSIGTSFQQFMQRNGPAIWGGAAALFMAGLNAKEGDWEAAGGNVAGAIVGGILTGGSPMGIIIGSAIGEGFLNFIRESGIEEEGAEAWLLGTPTALDTRGITTEELSDAEQSVKILEDAMEDLGLTMAGKVSVAFKNWFAEMKAGFTDTQVSQKDLVDTFSENEDILRSIAEGRPDARLLAGNAILTKEDVENAQRAIRELESLRARVQAEADSEAKRQSVINERVEETRDLYKEVRDENLAFIQTQLAAGKITNKQFQELRDNIETSAHTLTLRVQDALGEIRLSELGWDFTDIAEAISFASPQDIELLSQYTDAIFQYNDSLKEYNDLIAAGVTPTEAKAIAIDPSEADAALRAYQEIPLLQDRMRQNWAQLRSEPPFDIIKMPEIDPDEWRLVLERGLQYTDEDIAQKISSGLIRGLEADEVKENLEVFYVRLEDGTYHAVYGGAKDAFSDAAKDLEEEGKINLDAEIDNLSIRKFDYTQAQVEAAYARMEAFIRNAFPTYQFDYTDIAAIFKDGTDILHVDNTILQLALQELIDVNKKQLDGIYNLPSGASFYVPLQAYEMHAETMAAMAESSADSLAAFDAGFSEELQQVLDLLQKQFELAQQLETAETDEERNRILRESGKIFEDLRNLLSGEEGEELQEQLISELPNIATKMGEDFASYIAGIFGEALPAEDDMTAVTSAIETSEISMGSKLDLIYASVESLTNTNIAGFSSILGGLINVVNAIEAQTAAYTIQSEFGAKEIQAIPLNESTMLDTANQSQGLNETVETTLNLNLSINDQIQLVVDGQTLSEVLKTYLYQDMERLAGTSATLNNSVI